MELLFLKIVYNPIENRKKQKQSEDNFGPTVERTFIHG